MCSYDMPSVQWRKSSYSGGGNDCVELAVNTGGVGIRDSKMPTAGALWISAPGWLALRMSLEQAP